MIYVLSALTGLLILSSPILNGRFSQEIGSKRVTFLHYLSAAGTATLLYLFFSRAAFPHSAPPYVYAAGSIGILVLLLTNYYAPRIPAIYISILPVLGQLLMSMILERNLKMIPGLLLVILGMMLASSKDRRTLQTTDSEDIHAS